MSGPKTSRYTLTAEQRRILEEQRKLERRRAVAAESIRRTQKRLLQLGGMFDAEKRIAAGLRDRNASDNGVSALAAELEALIAPIQPVVAQTHCDDVASLEETAAAIRPCLAEAEKLAAQIAAVAEKNAAALQSALRDAIDQGFAASFAEADAARNAPPVEDEVARTLRQLRQDASLPRACQAEIDDALARLDSMPDETFRKNYIALSVNPLIRKARQSAAEYAECHEAFEGLYAEYAALCDLYGYVAQEYACTPASLQILRGEIQRIQDAAAEDDEQAYISKCLDDVMRDMGYAVLGSREVTKRSGKHFRSELYAYEEGTAVSITYASDGRIAMELGGLDTADRMPTAQETEALCDSMERFCGDFSEIEKRLAARGVILADRVSLLPPEAAYAQIINTDEYAMRTEVETIRVRKQRRSAVKVKAMRKE